MTDFEYPLTPNDEAGMYIATIAEAAFDAWSRGVEFADIFDDRTYKERTRSLISERTGDAMEQAGVFVSTEAEATQAEKERRVLAYIESGLDENAARRKVRGDYLKAFLMKRFRFEETDQLTQ
ncbi:MAG TPA: hypothetical protein VLF87_02100 [Patescibacteria group bacterium]|nr:hypothetical protein [Patescibacteria group bacterium]